MDRSADFALRPPSPSPTVVEWVREGGLHLQWRDRAGLDRLPCYAHWAPKAPIQFSNYRLLQPLRAGHVKRTLLPMRCAFGTRGGARTV